MTAHAASPAGVSGNYFLSIERLRLGLLWLTGFSSGVVLFEPAPYEFLVAITMGVFALTGLKIRAAFVPLLVLLLAIIITYMTSVLPVANRDGTVKWAIVSCFLAATSIFFAMVLAENTKARLDSILAGYVAGAVVVALIGIVAWFGKLPFQDTFLINGRARSTFKDANVFGPFLILPIMVVAVKVLTGHYRSLIVNGGIAGILCLALLLSFSRGAWGHFVGSVVIMIALCFLTAPTLKERARVTAFAFVGIAGAAVLLALLLSVDAIGALFQERASLVQSYDAGPQGRFGRHLAGFMLMLDFPNGIGPMQFTDYFTEDPHNSFLNAFVAGGWIGGFAHLLLMIVTLWFGLRHVFQRTPWQLAYIAIYATFAAEVAESWIIDVQHWRHFYLLIGLIWGLIAAGGLRARRAVASPQDGLYIPPPQRSVAQPG